MAGLHAVDVELGAPPRFERYQVAVRIAIALGLGIVGVTARSVVGALYVVLPVLAAIAIGTRRRWLEQDGPRLCDRPSTPLAVMTVAVVIFGAVLPYTALARLFAFTPLPAAYLAYVAAVVVVYMAVVEIVKARVMRRLGGEPRAGTYIGPAPLAASQTHPARTLHYRTPC